MNLIDNFPEGYTPSPKQNDVINKIDKAFSKGHKFVIVCAPTGTGKSFLAKTLANVTSAPSKRFKELIESNAAFERDQYGAFQNAEECSQQPSFGAQVLTITKGLQDQYKSLFTESELLKGKQNYICNIDDRYDVDVAPCIFDKKLKDSCILNDKCSYYTQRKTMLLNQFGVLNYSMFMSIPDHVKNKEYIICDEASEIEDELVKRFSRSLNYKVLAKLGFKKSQIPIENYCDFRIWLDSVIDALHKEVNSLKQQMKKHKGTIPLSDSNRYTLYNNILMQLQSTVDTWDSCEYIIETTEDEVTMKPFKVDRLASHIFDRGEKILLMSATIIDHKTFARTLGIKNFEYIEVETDFKPENAPIYIDRKNKLNYKNLREKLPELKDEIINICKHHKNDKGIIHTHTMQITEYLREHIDDERFLFRHPGENNESIIRKHIESPEPTILVSPSLSYGVDLKGDLAKFQIIAKASFLPLNDLRIKRLYTEDPEWYANKMLNNLIQACGRGVRSITDICDTYILDAAIYDCIMRNRDKIPKYFLDRYV
jgi:ATP-dependent DNA helicase DinG